MMQMFSLVNYPLFLFLAAVTVASPGPGILLSVGNAVRSGMPLALSGILGLAAGATIVGMLSVSGLGILVATSPTIYTILKYFGALYLLYLGFMQWKDAPAAPTTNNEVRKQKLKTFVQAMSMQFTNPKSIMFFVAVLPQFVQSKTPHVSQFALLVLTYASLVVLIHTIYALVARRLRNTGVSAAWRLSIRRLGSVAFMAFAVSLILSK